MVRQRFLQTRWYPSDYINGAESESITSQLQQMSRIYDGRILLIDSSFHIIKDTYDLDTDKTIISEEVIKSFRGEDSMNYDVDNHYVEMTIPLTTDNVESGEKSIIGVLLISVSTDSIFANPGIYEKCCISASDCRGSFTYLQSAYFYLFV